MHYPDVRLPSPPLPSAVICCSVTAHCCTTTRWMGLTRITHPPVTLPLHSPPLSRELLLSNGPLLHHNPMELTRITASPTDMKELGRVSAGCRPT